MLRLKLNHVSKRSWPLAFLLEGLKPVKVTVFPTSSKIQAVSMRTFLFLCHLHSLVRCCLILIIFFSSLVHDTICLYHLFSIMDTKRSGDSHRSNVYFNLVIWKIVYVLLWFFKIILRDSAFWVFCTPAKIIMEWPLLMNFCFNLDCFFILLFTQLEMFWNYHMYATIYVDVSNITMSEQPLTHLSLNKIVTISQKTFFKCI